MKRLASIATVVLVVSTACHALADFDSQTDIITSERWRSGGPLGGIGCVKIELPTDGSLGNFTINHNWDRPIGW